MSQDNPELGDVWFCHPQEVVVTEITHIVDCVENSFIDKITYQYLTGGMIEVKDINKDFFKNNFTFLHSAFGVLPEEKTKIKQEQNRLDMIE